MFNWFKKKRKSFVHPLMVRKNVYITSARIRGRWYGMMIILGDESGRNMSELLGKDKATEVLTMLEISNEFPEEFKVVNELLKIQTELENGEDSLSHADAQKDYLLGVVEAKQIYLDKRPWSDLKKLSDL